MGGIQKIGLVHASWNRSLAESSGWALRHSVGFLDLVVCAFFNVFPEEKIFFPCFPYFGIYYKVWESLVRHWRLFCLRWE